MQDTLERILLITTIALLFIPSTSSLKHHLVLTHDPRIYATVSSFGYLRGGRLDVIVKNLTLRPDPSEENDQMPKFGFVLIKSSDQMVNPFMVDRDLENSDTHLTCMANHVDYKSYDLVTMAPNPDKGKVIVKCRGDNNLPAITSLPTTMRSGRNHESHSGYIHKYTKRAAVIVTPESNQNDSINNPLKEENFNNPEQMTRPESNSCPAPTVDLPLQISTDEFGSRSYGFNFTMFIMHENQEGFYYLMFHNCKGDLPLGKHRRFETPTRFNLNMLIYETNYPEIYLSAGSIPLPQMYFVLSVIFFLMGCIWVNFISRQRESALRIHYLMTILVFAKSCSLLFHGINSHYIALYGQPVVTWAYLFYATRSIKGVLFFITLILIGSGWSFIRNILSGKDKKIIIFVVALQIIAHIGEIVYDESSEGQLSYELSAQICSIVDLICCLAILFPISSSVKHLEEASRTDGKAAINLKKLRLFKTFYIVSTVYIYITRIVTFIFLSILSYRYSWLANLVSEFATLIYFITTGSFFQPMPTNPYLLLSSDNDLEEDILFSVDPNDMNSTPLSNMDGKDQDRNTLLNENEQKVTRRIIDDIV